MNLILKKQFQIFLDFSVNKEKNLNLSGISVDEFLFVLDTWIKVEPKLIAENQIVIIASNYEESEKIFEIIENNHGNKSVFFPGHEVSPYDNIVFSTSIVNTRFSTLAKLTSGQPPNFVVTSLDAFTLKLPPKKYFNEHRVIISKDDILAPLELAKKLISLGYLSSASAEEPGTFVKKGEVFDIHTIDSNIYRIIYFDDLIETIYAVDPTTQKSIRDQEITSIDIFPAPLSVFENGEVLNLKKHIPTPRPQFREKIERRNNLFFHLDSSTAFDRFDVFHNLLFNEHEFFIDYLKNPLPIFSSLNSLENSVDSLKNLLLNQFNEAEKEDNILPSPEVLFNFNSFFKKFVQVTNLLIPNEDNNNEVYSKFEIAPALPLIKSQLKKLELFKLVYQKVTQSLASGSQVVFCFQAQAAKEEFCHILLSLGLENEYLNKILFINSHHQIAFLDLYENSLFLSEGEIFSSKTSRLKNVTRKNIDLFADQISSLKEGDFVVHAIHGIGKYIGMKRMEINSYQTDFLAIEYEENDKIYVPVYKLNLIQKHSDAENPKKLANLRTNKFQQAKDKAKESAKKLAFNLLELQAKRKLQPSFSFSPPDHLYKEFELDFSFKPTRDQTSAIEDVLNDMQSDLPMDRLVCGDVGFGKTEVAMRAAFKAVLDKKQVAVLVPTTILALQHYQTFLKRMKPYSVNIDFLSRFKSTKESIDIVKKIEEGSIDIIIGTHKLLSEKIKYFDLGLVIVDEEHRFGVGHKEKIKLLKASIDFLTLTATPIPRTMQLSFLGIKDLSLIQTPPPKRQSVKTHILKENQNTLKEAINFELKRGGQVYFVHNRVENIESIAASIKQLVPLAKILIAHGQLPEKELEKRMKSFYEGEFNILVCTTIIESGIDIPTANTMIINRADTFGLAQLHQLRGRIGRSDRKAYAYFVIPNRETMTSISLKRLQTMQTYTEIGSGFQIANADLEIRGAGDILGAEQSGHLESIGLEVYLELLNEAILELKGQPLENSIIDIEISLNEQALIPENYISDTGERLKYYKKLSNSKKIENLESLRDELNDKFGHLPIEVSNLILIIECRLILQKLCLKSVQQTNQKIVLRFDQNLLNQNPIVRDKIVDFFLKRPKVYKFSPNYVLVYQPKGVVDKNTLWQFSKDIAQQILA
jgi:transcription-repair coupling factor (superfamily II helicase)